MPEEPEEYDIYYSKFAVGDKPYCVWERDLAKRNLEYLESLDPTYFEYVAEVNGTQLDAGDSSARRHAAVAIRFAYHHGLETLFAILFAALQAPDCVVGWMQRYDTESLRDLVRSVDRRKPRYLKVKPKPYTWEGISAKIIPSPADDDGTFAVCSNSSGTSGAVSPESSSTKTK